MTLRRLLLLAGVLLILFLGMYSWNQRTHTLDGLAAQVGLELAGAVLKPIRTVQDSVEGVWTRYFDLVGVREENQRLRQEVQDLQARLLANGEDLAELHRLRALVAAAPWTRAGVPWGRCVLAGLHGPQRRAGQHNHQPGLQHGGRPGTPLVTNLGLVGRCCGPVPTAPLSCC